MSRTNAVTTVAGRNATFGLTRPLVVDRIRAPQMMKAAKIGVGLLKDMKLVRVKGATKTWVQGGLYNIVVTVEPSAGGGASDDTKKLDLRIRMLIHDAVISEDLAKEQEVAYVSLFSVLDIVNLNATSPATACIYNCMQNIEEDELQSGATWAVANSMLMRASTLTYTAFGFNTILEIANGVVGPVQSAVMATPSYASRRKKHQDSKKNEVAGDSEDGEVEGDNQEEEKGQAIEEESTGVQMLPQDSNEVVNWKIYRLVVKVGRGCKTVLALEGEGEGGVEGVQQNAKIRRNRRAAAGGGGGEGKLEIQERQDTDGATEYQIDGGAKKGGGAALAALPKLPRITPRKVACVAEKVLMIELVGGTGSGSTSGLDAALIGVKALLLPTNVGYGDAPPEMTFKWVILFGLLGLGYYYKYGRPPSGGRALGATNGSVNTTDRRQ